MRKVTLLMFALVMVSLTVSAGTKRHAIKLFGPSEVNGTVLKAGDYAVAIEQGNAVFYREGKEVAKAPAHAEENASKYTVNSVLYGADERVVNEIRLGGSSTRLVLDGVTAAKGATGRAPSGTK